MSISMLGGVSFKKVDWSKSVVKKEENKDGEKK